MSPFGTSLPKRCAAFCLELAKADERTLSNVKGNRSAPSLPTRVTMLAQLANESFRADHVRFGNSVGAVV